MRKSFWIPFLLVLAGIVIGSLLSEITAGVPVLGWLAYGLDFGTGTPFILDLHLLQLTFGITIRITAAQILSIALNLLAGKSLLRR